jgi:hypothetical protein
MESHALKGNALNLGTPVDNPGACQIESDSWTDFPDSRACESTKTILG